MKHFRRFFFFLILLFAAIVVKSQKVNRLPLKKFKVATLSDSLKEISGLTFIQDRLFAINDGGNSPTIFELSSGDGKIVKKIELDIANVDWEGVASDRFHLYIGDFGNNLGNRQDLKVYKISLGDSVSISSEFPFRFSQQKGNVSTPYKHDFDVESVIFLNNSLHIFTKGWKSKRTSHYKIELEQGDLQEVRELETYQGRYLATDTYYFNGKLYVVGYNTRGKVFLSIFEKQNDHMFFSKPPKTFVLGNALSIGQIESMAIHSKGIFLGSEEFIKKPFKVKPTFYFIPFSALKSFDISP